MTPAVDVDTLCSLLTADAKLSGLTHAAVALCVTETNEAEGWLLSEPVEVQCFHFVKLKRLHNQIHYFRHFQDSRNIPIFSILLSRPVGTTNIIQTLSITQCFVGQLQRIQGRVAGTVANTPLWFDCSFPAVRHSSAAETQATLLHHNNVMSLYWSMNTDEHIHTWSWTRVELTYLPLKRDIQNMFMLAVIWPVTPRLLQTPTIST